MQPLPNLKKSSAFTLIEVMIALALLAFSMATVINALSYNSFQLANMRDRFHANRIAMHVAGDYYLKYQWPKTGKKTDTITIGEAEWEWSAQVTETREKRLRKITISIFDNQPSANNQKSTIAKHIFFVSNPYAPK